MNSSKFTIKCDPLKVLLVISLFLAADAMGQIPTEKVDSLNTAATDLLQGNPRAAIQLSIMALRNNKNSLYREGAYRSFLNLGIAYSQTSTFDSAVAFLRKSETFFTEGKEYGLIQYYLGLNYCNLERFESAQIFFKVSRDVFRDLNEWAYLADALRALGFVEMQLGNNEEALSFFRQAWEKKRDFDLNAISELRLISQLYRKMGREMEATNYAKKALNEARKLGDPREIEKSILQIAENFSRIERTDSAAIFYQQLLDNPITGISAQKIQAIQGLTRLMRNSGESDEAVTLIKEYLKKQKNADSTSRWKLQSILVESYLNAGRWKAGIELGTRLVEQFEQRGMIQEALHVAIQIIRAAESIDDLELALTYHQLRSELQQKLDALHAHEVHEEWRKRVELLDLSNEITLTSHSEQVSYLRKERVILLVSLIFGLILIFLLILLLWYRNQMLKGLAEREGIKKNMHQAQEDLYKQTLHMMHMNNCLNEVEEQVKLLMAAQPDQKLSKILKSIRMNKSMDRDWDNFNSYFGNVNVGFYEKLSEHSEKLSNHDRRVCALIKLNLTNREIATILNIEVKSVSMIKYRIKKKLNLDDEMELSHFITQL